MDPEARDAAVAQFAAVTGADAATAAHVLDAHSWNADAAVAFFLDGGMGGGGGGRGGRARPAAPPPPRGARRGPPPPQRPRPRRGRRPCATRPRLWPLNRARQVGAGWSARA
jgi:hypothetical protein